MPICRVIWMAGRPDETKKKLRETLNERLAAAVNVRPDQINVYFEDHPAIDMPKDGALVRIYVSEGRPDAVKDAICEAVASSIGEVAGIDEMKVNLVITDIRPGNLGVGRKIVNRGGIPTELMRQGKMEDLSAQ